MNNQNPFVKGLKCFNCGVFIPGSFPNLTHHFRNRHRWKTGRTEKRRLFCGQNGCPIEVQDFGSYRNHQQRCPYIVNGNSRQEITNESVRNSIESGDRSQFEIETPEENCDQTLVETHENSDREVPSKACIDNSLSLLMLKLRANYLVSHSAMDFFIKELNKVLTHVEKGILTVTDLKTSLRSLSSQKKRATHFKSTFGLIQSQTKTLGTARVRRYNKKKKPFVHRKIKTYETVSLKDTLESLFSIPTFRQLYFSERRSTDVIVRSSIDGELCQRHPIFSTVPHSLRLQVYFDDIEPNNALGSKVRKHQIGAFL